MDTTRPSAVEIIARLLASEGAADYLGDPARIWVNPDCGLRTRKLDIATRKLESVVRGATIARDAVESPRR